MARSRLLGVGALSWLVLLAACTPDEEGDDGGTGGTIGAPTTNIQIDGGSSSAQGLGDEEACAAVHLNPQPATEVVEVEVTRVVEVLPQPVAIYFMVDNSISMERSSSDPQEQDFEAPTKWEQAVDAITQFVTDPESEGVEATIQYFHPLGEYAKKPDVCDGAAHAIPAVEMGELPANANAIIASFDDVELEGNTPTAGALTGATEYCRTFRQQHPDEKCVVVLVTDGQPHGCGLENEDDGITIDPEAKDALTPIAEAAAKDGVTIFAIGMDGVSADGFELLDAVAAAGGADCTPETPGHEACDVSTTGTEGFVQALSTIREVVLVRETTTEQVTQIKEEEVTLDCQWTIPAPPEGRSFDKQLVNVNVVLQSGEVTPIGYVPTAADCAVGGWYYDNPGDPNTIVVCPNTCDLLTNGAAQVELLFGCATKVR